MPTDPDTDYRHAKDSIAVHRRVQATAELALVAFLKSKRAVPRHLLYDLETGEPSDPVLIRLHADVDRAAGDVRWCQALVVACGEVVKGRTFAEAGGR